MNNKFWGERQERSERIYKRDGRQEMVDGDKCSRE